MENPSYKLSLEQIKENFSVPLHQAALKLQVSVKDLKRRCRELNIARWPYKKRKTLITISQLGNIPNEKDNLFNCFKLSQSSKIKKPCKNSLT